MSVAYDAGVLIAADRDDRRVWADHRVRLEAGVLPRTTAPVVAQVSRSDRQVQLGRFLAGCEVVDFSASDAHGVGQLVGEAGASDVVDAHLVIVATERSSTIITSDADDIRRLVSASSISVDVVEV